MSAVELRVVGGGSKNPLWRQIIADAFQLPLRCSPFAILGQALRISGHCCSMYHSQHHDALRYEACLSHGRHELVDLWPRCCQTK